MKNRFTERVLQGVLSVVMLFAGLGLALVAAVRFGFFKPEIGLGDNVLPALALACGILMVLAGVTALFPLRRRRTTGYVRNESADCALDISLETVDLHLLHCLGNSYQQVGLLEHSVYAMRGGVGVQLLIDLPIGTDIPSTVAGLKADCCQFITSCTGLNVSEFTVQVSGTQKQPSLPETVEDPVREEEDAFTRQLFCEEKTADELPQVQPDNASETLPEMEEAAQGAAETEPEMETFPDESAPQAEDAETAREEIPEDTL